MTVSRKEEDLVSDTSCSQTEQEEVGFKRGPISGVRKATDWVYFCRIFIMKVILRVESRKVSELKH